MSSSSKIRFNLPQMQIKQMTSKEDPKLAEKRNQLRSMKYNQRSQFDFAAKGLYGPNALLFESLSKEDKERVLSTGWSKEDPYGEHHLYWAHPPEKVLVIKKHKDNEITKSFMELTQWLVQEKNLTVIVEPAILKEELICTEAYLPIKHQLQSWKEQDLDSQSCLLEQVDFVICVGGDGTLLYTSSMFQKSIPPIMSFHMGSLGFLTPFQFYASDSNGTKCSSDSENGADTQIVSSVPVYRAAIEKVMRGGVSMTLRHRLLCTIQTDHEVKTSSTELCPVSPSYDPPAKFDLGKLRIPESSECVPSMLVMNDLVVDRGPNPYLTNLIISCNGRKMTSVQGDGIIIATPTGSTAYSLAAGASMVHPSVPSMIVTPICPHSLSFRSIVVPSGVELSIEVAPSSRNSAWVSFDGRNRQEIIQGHRVTVVTSSCPVPSINNTGHVTDWFDSLAECLHWNVRKEQKAIDASK